MFAFAISFKSTKVFDITDRGVRASPKTDNDLLCKARAHGIDVKSSLIVLFSFFFLPECFLLVSISGCLKLVLGCC